MFKSPHYNCMLIVEVGVRGIGFGKSRLSMHAWPQIEQMITLRVPWIPSFPQPHGFSHELASLPRPLHAPRAGRGGQRARGKAAALQVHSCALRKAGAVVHVDRIRVKAAGKMPCLPLVPPYVLLRTCSGLQQARLTWFFLRMAGHHCHC